MAKCPKCGEEIEEGDSCCHICGHDLTKNFVESSPVKKESNNKTSPDKKGFNNKIIAVIAIVVIIAIVAVLASGMFSNDNSSDDVKADDKVTDSVNEDTSDKSTSSSEYWASAKADKFHLPTCEWAEKISDDNKIIYDTREDAIADGKEPCGACNP